MIESLGPVSAKLEEELRTAVRKYGIVVWLDADDHYSDFVERLAELRATGTLPYEVHAYRDSYLELIFALESLSGGVDRKSLVIHMPTFNEENIKETPLLELYLAGTRFRKALNTLIKEAAGGQIRPDDIAGFASQTDVTLEAADQWLADHLAGRGDGLATHLRNLVPTAVIEELLSRGRTREESGSPNGRQAIDDYFETKLGLPDSWRDEAVSTDPQAAADAAFLAVSWALCVEYVDDLRRAPVDPKLVPAKNLPRLVVDNCRELANYLRLRHSEFYRRTAQETEEWLTQEVTAACAEDLGEIDTFRFEEEKVLQATLVALEQRNWALANQWTQLRADANSIWLRDDPARRSAWQLIGDAARLGIAIQEAGPSIGAVASLDRAVERYEQAGFKVDQAHRHLEQRRQSQLTPSVPEFEILRQRLESVRCCWREWADGWAREFNQLCRQHGFLPEAAFQQRGIFDDVVKPLVDDTGLTVLLLIDALRFEMAHELMQLLGTPAATTVQLRSRLAELPTVTEVGMNVLAPVAERGRLRPVIENESFLGFSTGQFRVNDPETRKRAMHDRVGGATSPWFSLKDIVSKDVKSLKKSVTKARLVVVHSRDIDEAGEAGQGLSVFADVLQQLRSAWKILRDVGARRFVVTADHGFLLRDAAADPALPYGRKIDPHPRYVITTVAEHGMGKVCVALGELGFDAPGLHLVMPETTAVFDTGDRGKSFNHGGNSLQERVIPVLTLVHRAAAGGSTLEYVVTAAASRGVADLHCLAGQVAVGDQMGLEFGGLREVELALQIVDAVDARVELTDARGGATIVSGAVVATIGQPFEIFFRLRGMENIRVQVQLCHAGTDADVRSCLITERFDVQAIRKTEPSTSPVSTSQWLDDLPQGGVRKVFDYVAVHGVITEEEASRMLGSPRAARQFARNFEEFARKAPFAVRIDVVAGVKRYVREGASI